MKKYIYFGEIIQQYKFRVLNEREARAGAGILFLFAFFSFMHSYILRDFIFTQIFVTVFMIDFIIRIFINPKFAPSLILGRIMVQNQVPEYVGAAQKRWAWFIGLYLSIIMFFVIVIFNIMTPMKIVICLLCLALLYSEAVFGICIGCKLFNYIYKENPKLCPGGTCEMHQKEEIQKISLLQKAIIITFILLVSSSVYLLALKKTPPIQSVKKENISHLKCGASKGGMQIIITRNNLWLTT